MSQAKPRRGMRLLVFQHFHAEHLGRFGPMLQEDGVEVHKVALDEGEPIPSLDNVDALWALGGPQQVWQEDEYPWLAAEKEAIREAVIDRKLPFFGLCLGHQLLAESLGGKTGVAEKPEVGILPAHLTAQGKQSPLFRNFPPVFDCVQGHGAEVKAAPPSTEILAQSPDCKIQAMAYAGRAFSVQFHAELTLEMIDACLELPEYKHDFEAMMGIDGIARFREQTVQRAPEFDTCARMLYENWMSCAAG